MVPQYYMLCLCVCVIFSGVVRWVAVAGYASCFVLFCSLVLKIGKNNVAAVVN